MTILLRAAVLAGALLRQAARHWRRRSRSPTRWRRVPSSLRASLKPRRKRRPPKRAPAKLAFLPTRKSASRSRTLPAPGRFAKCAARKRRSRSRSASSLEASAAHASRSQPRSVILRCFRSKELVPRSRAQMKTRRGTRLHRAMVRDVSRVA